MAELPAYVEVGRVRRPHGVRGAVLVRPSTDVATRFDAGSSLEIALADGRRRSLTVVAAASHGDALRVTLAEVTDRDEAEALRGGSLEVRRESTPPAPAGSYYYFELAGCRCTDVTEGALGDVVDVSEDGGGLLLEVDDGERRLTIPFVREYVREVDVKQRRIDLELPLGLVDACAST